ncbi:MAG: hypothetical protein JWO42_1350 [Chloroflexi bacterium]|nr:hypothetical protein [Chloroflexota bacterium]
MQISGTRKGRRLLDPWSCSGVRAYVGTRLIARNNGRARAQPARAVHELRSAGCRPSLDE